MMRTIFIRADAGKNIGTGHIMRCIAIAQQLIKAQNNRVFFLTTEKQAGEMITERGFDCLYLSGDGEALQAETEEIERIVQNYAKGPMALLVDSYRVDTNNFKVYGNIKKEDYILKIIYMDDLGEKKYPVDMIINYNIFSDNLPYDHFYQNSSTRLLLGCKYVPLREEFMNQRKQTAHKHSGYKMLITVGGSDSFGICPAVVEYLRQDKIFDPIELNVVLGAYSPHYKRLCQLKETYGKIEIYSNVKNMAKLIVSCDFAVSAGGATLYELCACGVPGITISFADNQIPAVRAFAEKKLMPCAGDYRESRETCLEYIAYYVKQYLGNQVDYKEKKQAIEKLVDAKGSQRIAKAINSLIEESMR